ncbi:MAG: septum formation initiator family protein [Moraxellaceae bacterium]|nr:septum formation initiator family protein [Pseudobdellovibrionaceae bacterium]
MDQLKSVTYKFQGWLYQPYKVFILCLCLLCGSLLLNGTVWKVWGLYRDEAKFKAAITKTIDDTKALTVQMTVVKDPQYIERLAKDKMDLVGENDLMFVFPN